MESEKEFDVTSVKPPGDVQVEFDCPHCGTVTVAVYVFVAPSEEQLAKLVELLGQCHERVHV